LRKKAATGRPFMSVMMAPVMVHPSMVVVRPDVMMVTPYVMMTLYVVVMLYLLH
jgi:hypothetical protein